MGSSDKRGAPIRGRVAYNMQTNTIEVLHRGEWEPAVDCYRHGWTPRASSMKPGRLRWVCRACQDAALKAADETFFRRMQRRARTPKPTGPRHEENRTDDAP